MLVYVGAGPVPFPAAAAAALPFFSSTKVLKLCAACAMLGWRPPTLIGVALPVTASEAWIAGVDWPLLFCVAITDASLRDASPTICLRFLLRRCGGFQFGLRNGFDVACMSSLSSSAWCVFSSDAAVKGAMVRRKI